MKKATNQTTVEKGFRLPWPGGLQSREISRADQEVIDRALETINTPKDTDPAECGEVWAGQ